MGLCAVYLLKVAPMASEIVRRSGARSPASPAVALPTPRTPATPSSGGSGADPAFLAAAVFAYGLVIVAAVSAALATHAITGSVAATAGVVLIVASITGGITICATTDLPDRVFARSES